ncbi:7-carboxy-7-deazaguanine synthase QueE, partial [Enterococcus faecalis]|nr:7-carboxy-7-deazaguanine synthase QueE [Enterococcus faecalis]
TVNFETLDFIVSQLDKDQVTFKIPVFNDDDLAFAKMLKKRYQPVVLYLSSGNPEPHASGNIVEAQLNRLRQLWETVAADPE